MFRKLAVLTGILVLAGSPALADFTYQETSTITGGAMASMMRVVGVFSKQAREPIQSTVSVKGDRMLHRSATHASVIDLGSGRSPASTSQKKQYSVMTFDEMKQMLDQMAQKMKQNDKGEMNFKVSANSTGKTKQVAGFDAKEMVMTMEMEGKDKEERTKRRHDGGHAICGSLPASRAIRKSAISTSAWRRRSNWTPGGNMFMQNPQVSQGMAEVYKEAAKVDGVPVQQIITMGAAGTVQPSDGVGSTAAAATSRRGASLGGRRAGRSARRKVRTGTQEDTTKNRPTSRRGHVAAIGRAIPGSLLEMTTEMSSFSAKPWTRGYSRFRPGSRRSIRTEEDEVIRRPADRETPTWPLRTPPCPREDCVPHAFLRPLFRQDWVVYAKRPFGGPEHVLHYLARYTHRVAISNHRIVNFADGKVTFRWKDYAHKGKQRR